MGSEHGERERLGVSGRRKCQRLEVCPRCSQIITELGFSLIQRDGVARVGSLTTGTLVSFLLYQYNLTGALSSIADIWSGMQEAIGSARKIFSILDRQPALRNDGVCVVIILRFSSVYCQCFTFILPLLETTFFLY